jgi:hypothetical protein
VHATVAGRAKVLVSDGVSTVESALFHPGTGLVFMTATMTVGGSPTAITVGGSVAAGNTTAVFSGMTLVLGNYLSDSVISYTPRKAVIPFHLQAGATFANGTTAFFHSAGADNAEANAAVSVPYRGVARNFFCVMGGSSSAGQFAFTMRRGGADTALVAIISGAGVTTASDTTDEVEYTKGQSMCMRVVASGGTATLTGLGAYIEYEEVPFP